MIIEHLGKTVDSKHFDGVLEPDKIKHIRDNYFNENKELAIKQLESVLLKGTTLTNHIYNYYFERVACDSLFHSTKWSINQALESDQLVQLFINKTKANLNVFPNQGLDSLVSNFKTALRLAGKGFASKVSNFPLKECNKILSNLKAETGGGIYLDPCCGWGIRLLSSAVNDLAYIGFDVNANLIPKLNELAEDIKKIKPDFTYQIVGKGSQYYIEDLNNLVDFSFTSPPYFNLEDYGNNSLEENNSYRQGVSYQHWLDNFVNPLVDNLTKYVKGNGLVAFNVKNFKDYKLEEDFTKICIQHKLEPYACYPLKNIVRNGGNASNGQRMQVVDNSEWIYVFKNNK